MMPYLSIPVILFNGGTYEEKVECPKCRGEQYCMGKECDRCDRTGLVTKEATQPESKQVTLRLTPQCIESFYPCFYEGASMIVMMSGKEYMTPASCEAIEQGIVSYWNMVNKAMVPKSDSEQGRIVTLAPTP